MKLFGTDGIRGIWGEGLFQSNALKKISYSIAKWLQWKMKNKRGFYEQKIVLIGRDTRKSGKKIEKIIVDVLRKHGFDIGFLGVVPTQIISYFARLIKPIQAIAITASHNPPQYNGIKLIDNDGLKIPREDEERIEEIYNKTRISQTVSKKGAESKRCCKTAELICDKSLQKRLSKTYIESAAKLIGNIDDTYKRKLRIILDCANGATYKVAPEIFRYFGIKNLKVINDNSSGNNINVECGVVNIDKTTNHLKQENAQFDFLISFDGDGDRVYIVDNRFNLYDGDALLALFTYYYSVLKKENLKCIVGTIMSNMGLEKFCKELGINFIRTAVGDREVTLRILKENTFLGGEPSGHIVNLKINSYGDGILNAVFFTKIYTEYPQILTDTMKRYKPYQSYLLNIDVEKKVPLENLHNFKKCIEKYNNYAKMGTRVVARYSGTENVLRILVEAKEKKQGIKIAEELKNIYLKEYKLGGK